MLRSFGIQTLSGSAQPALGDVLTAAFVPPADLSQAFKVTVGNSALYQQGDRIILGAGQAGANAVLVIGLPDATHLLCMSEGGASLKAWNNATIIALDIACALILFKAQNGNSQVVWLGSDSTVTKAGAGSAFADIGIGGSYSLGVPQWNTLRSSEAWMAGTLNDKIGVAIDVV